MGRYDDSYEGPGNEFADEIDWASLLGGAEDEGGARSGNVIGSEIVPSDGPTVTLRPPTGFSPMGPGGIEGEGRHGETPRERSTALGGDSPEAAQATLRRPSAPEPMSGSQFTAGSSEGSPGGPGGSTESMGVPGGVGAPGAGFAGGVMPFSPLSGPDPVSGATPRLRSLYGKSGGLQGGGLGVPGASSVAANDPIQGLIQLLMKGRA